MDDAQNITGLLKDWGRGDRAALNKLMPLVYDELRQQASRHLRKESKGHTLQTTALIHEAYLKLVGQNRVEWQDRRHFFAIASTVMRRVLVDHARHQKRERRGGSEKDVPLDGIQLAGAEKSVDLVALDEALDRLASLSPRQARVVELRYFSGLSNDECADVLGVSNATVRNDWNIARAWLYEQIRN